MLVEGRISGCILAHCLAVLTAVPSNVRSTDAGILERLREGCSRSSTFKALVDELDQLGTIVYVEHGICGFGHYKACLPHSVTIAGGIRFLRIVVERGQGAAQELGLIGHELQHALEIARAPDIRSSDDITALFRRIGHSPHCPRGTPDCYETSAALAVGDSVLREVLASVNAPRR